MRLMGIMMNTMMKTALEETVAQALLKKVKKLDKSSGQSCSNCRWSPTNSRPEICNIIGRILNMY